MSSWVVSKAHIDLLRTAVLAQTPTSLDRHLTFYYPNPSPPAPGLDILLSYTVDHQTATDFGAELWAQNLGIVNTRYRGAGDLPGLPVPRGRGAP